MFNLADILTITAVVVNLILGFLVFLSNPRKALNISFAFFAFIMSAWVFSNFIFEIIPNILIFKTQYALGAAGIPAALLWILIISEKKIKPLEVFLFSIAGLIAAFLPYAGGLIIKNLQIGSQGSVLTTGYLFSPYSIFILIFYVFIIYEIISGIREYSDVRKIQLEYVLLGALIFGGVTMLVNFILPFFKITPVAPYDAQSSIFYVGFTAYAVTKHHMFNVKVIATELLTFAIWIVLFVKIFLVGSMQEVILNSAIFIIVLFFGVLLMRSVINEVKQKEEIQKIEKELEKAYQVERKANEELEKLDKYKNDFLRQAQHDLKNPLTVLMGYSDLLLSGSFGKIPKKGVDIIKRMQVVIQGKLRDIANFLNVEQFKMGKGVILLKPGIELDAILEEIVAGLAYNAETKGIYLKFERPQKPIVISADREKLKSAIFNIVDNSIKYTAKGGVDIKVEGDGTTKIIISDTGIGIPKDKIESIFQTQFERTKQAEKAAGGSGVGLYLSTQIIKMHNGKVWAESGGEGNGSTFYIELPTEQEARAVTEESLLGKSSAL